jgi:sec-independent protein translocase protein TatB
VFNVTGSEIVLLLLVALIVLGPEKLPDAMRRFGRTYGELKRMSHGFQAELRDALEEPSRELRSTVQAAKDIVQGPVQEVRSTAKDVNDLARGTPSPTKAPSARKAAEAGTTEKSGTQVTGTGPAAATGSASDVATPEPTPTEAEPLGGPGIAELDTVPDELWDGEPEG